MARIALAALALAALAVAADARISALEWNNHVAAVFQAGAQTGMVTKLGGVDAYVAAPPGGKPAAAVIMFPDVYGWEFNNTRLWADRLAQRGFLVVLPDFFRGSKLAEWKGPLMDWVKQQTPERALKDYEAVVADIRKRYPSIKKIGQQGFCWGGLFTALLTSGKATAADAAVAYHASMLTPELIDRIRGPVRFEASDPKLDNQVNSTFYAYIDKAFAAKRAQGLDVSITPHPGQPHGIAALRGGGPALGTPRCPAQPPVGTPTPPTQAPNPNAPKTAAPCARKPQPPAPAPPPGRQGCIPHIPPPIPVAAPLGASG